MIGKYKLSLFLALLFLGVSLFTLKDYGISWDEPIHFVRGQAYLNYFLTGEKTFNNIKIESYYENPSYDAKTFLNTDGGHPPLNGILSALTNLIFYQKLHLFGDIQAYQLFNIFCTSLLVFVVSAFAFETIGRKGAIFAAIAISFYPILFAESHFNIKDPAETAFYALSIWSFWKSLNKFSWKWLLLSAVAVGIAFSIKFNILFLPFIIVPYLILRFWGKYGITLKKIPKSYLLTLLLCPVIAIVIFFGSWPYLWSDPIGNFIKVFGYYKQIGASVQYQSGYSINGFNFYALIWILFTTPPIILFFSIFGFIDFVKKRAEYFILWIIWLAVPILRVTIPGMGIYGGIRQILEFLPALVLIFAYGVNFLFLKISNKTIAFLSFVGIVFFLVLPVAIYHPNENVYFNFLIGGLAGAKKANIPSWGDSFGNAYLQTVNWLNKNAPTNAVVALIEGTGANVPIIQLRSDIRLSNDRWSGIERKGEYLMELTYNESVNPYPYAWDYVNTFLKPVYEVKEDGVPIAKVWKNDFSNTNPKFQLLEKPYTGRIKILKKYAQVILDLGNNEILSRFIATYNRTNSCDLVDGTFYISSDGKNWKEQMSPLSAGQIPGIGAWQDKKTKDLIYLFPGDTARYIRFDVTKNAECFLTSARYKVIVFK